MPAWLLERRVRPRSGTSAKRMGLYANVGGPRKEHLCRIRATSHPRSRSSVFSSKKILDVLLLFKNGERNHGDGAPYRDDATRRRGLHIGLDG